MRRFVEAPRFGEVYNLGGGRENSISILEAFDLIASISGRKMEFEYVDQNRQGDHMCYISNLDKMKAHYPGWGITKDLRVTFEEIHRAWLKRTEARP
jgi:CDP-paratose 2-epimerase